MRMNTDQKSDPTERVEWDEKVASLGHRVPCDGASRWIVQMRIENQMRKRVIGDGNDLSPEDARRAAIVAKPPAPFIRVRDFTVP